MDHAFEEKELQRETDGRTQGLLKGTGENWGHFNWGGKGVNDSKDVLKPQRNILIDAYLNKTHILYYIIILNYINLCNVYYTNKPYNYVYIK